MPPKRKPKVESEIVPDRVSVTRDRRIGLPKYGSMSVGMTLSAPIPLRFGSDYKDAVRDLDEMCRKEVGGLVKEILDELERDEPAYGLDYKG